MEAVWKVYGKRADFKAIGEKYNIDQVVARVIRNRDVISDEEINLYLNGTMDDVYAPELMADMDKGCSIIMEKIQENKHIRIISDYDVDGVMSNYILLEGLKNAGAVVSYEIPDRMLDGYGINERIIQDAKKDGVDTIITCDNGIATFSAIELAKDLGMTVVVTDHHQVPFEEREGIRTYKLVPADAVIDIQREDCQYPFKEICGAMVAYKFIKCLYDKMDLIWDNPDRYVEMVAIATVCDVMELTRENRIFVKKGLKLLKNPENIGLKSLLIVNEIYGRDIYSYHLGFVIGPCINATGRLESAKKGLELLLCNDADKAMILAQELLELNSARKDMTNRGVDEALKLVEEKLQDDKVLVVYMPKLHESLAGIVAGRIREIYYKPVFVVTNGEGGILKGSGRSIDGYHMFEALSGCKELLLKYGGHKLAAGFSLEQDKLNDFINALNANHGLTEEDLTPVVYIDVPMPMDYITPKLVQDLKLLEPFGKGNEKPVFGQSALGIKEARLIGKEGKILKILFQDSNGYITEGIDFNGNKLLDCIKMWFTDEECDKMLKGLPNNIKLDVAYYPDINEYNGRQRIQVKPVLYKKSSQ